MAAHLSEAGILAKAALGVWAIFRCRQRLGTNTRSTTTLLSTVLAHLLVQLPPGAEEVAQLVRVLVTLSLHEGQQSQN